MINKIFLLQDVKLPREFEVPGRVVRGKAEGRAQLPTMAPPTAPAALLLALLVLIRAATAWSPDSNAKLYVKYGKFSLYIYHYKTLSIYPACMHIQAFSIPCVHCLLRFFLSLGESHSSNHPRVNGSHRVPVIFIFSPIRNYSFKSDFQSL